MSALGQALADYLRLRRSLGHELAEASWLLPDFVAYLDARSALPIANDLRFHLALFRAAKEQSWCHVSEASETEPGDLYAQGLSGIGFEPPVLCNVDPTTFAEFLAQQTARNLPKEQLHEVIRYGTPRIHRPRRVLPHPQAPAAQLSLFGVL